MKSFSIDFKIPRFWLCLAFSQPQWRLVVLAGVAFFGRGVDSVVSFFDMAEPRSTAPLISPSQLVVVHESISHVHPIVQRPSAKMPLFRLAFALLSAISQVAAVQVSSLPVSSVISSASSSSASAVTYANPTGSASSVLASSSTVKFDPQAVAATPAAAAPYWLESITHQGISAFNSNPASYQVFRNVQSFGAKGK
jgi:hypothetical protein